MNVSAGLVIIQDNKILLGHPTGAKWFGTYSIPKGGVNKNETHVDAAIRETLEELGVHIYKEEVDTYNKKYIDYKDVNGEVYKRLYYFMVKPIDPIVVDLNKLQKEEIDWAGFLGFEEAEKRIFWRFRSLLHHIS
jgi:bis(5'-nucleosidyl)-tetraphosphatase